MRANGGASETTTAYEMMAPLFWIGWNEVWDGKPFDASRRDVKPFAYERGRQVAVLARSRNFTRDALIRDPYAVLKLFDDAVTMRHVR